jgi:hypothetical protein
MTEAPVLPMPAPEPLPVKLIARLRAVISAEVSRAANPQDRKHFSELLDHLTPDPLAPWKLPSSRADGKADLPNIRAVLYAQLRHVLDLLWRKAPAKEIEPLVVRIEKIAALPDLTGYYFVGGPGTGWTLEENE